MNEFIAFFESLLGVYTPVLNIDGSVAVGMAGVDFPYIFRCIFFGIVVFSVLRIIGGVICKTY